MTPWRDLDIFKEIFWPKAHHEYAKMYVVKIAEFWSSFDSLLGLDLAS